MYYLPDGKDLLEFSNSTTEARELLYVLKAVEELSLELHSDCAHEEGCTDLCLMAHKILARYQRDEYCN